MEIKEIKIKKGQKLSDIYPQIETNIILNKTLSGIGATYTEIMAPRDSIIIVPNLPVIYCKVNKHKKEHLFGVMQKVTSDDISEYIEKAKNKGWHIKIMTTPESFYKVRNAFKEIDMSMHDTCFLLLDECHKFIKDKGFRHEITEPFREFFKFKNKAMVSATPIVPSDPRFEEQNFRGITIVPDYKYLHDILLISVNNIRAAFKDFSSTFNRDVKDKEKSLCFFVNSVEMIKLFIGISEINEDSVVFCADRNVEKLKHAGIKNVHSSWDLKYKKRFMFFTSRFYNGLDIELNEKPFVFFISDSYRKEFSAVDPYTEIPQAIGRFRNGVEQIFHIVAFNHSIESRDKEGIERYVTTIEKTYRQLKESYDNSENLEERRALKSFMENMPLKEIFFDDEKDYFVLDNYIDNELIKSSYKNVSSLSKRYSLSLRLIYPSVAYEHYSYGEKERQKIMSAQGFKKDQRKAIVEALDLIKSAGGTEKGNEYIRELRSYDELIVDAYFKLGKETIEKNNYSPKKLKELIILKDYKENTRKESFIKVLFNSFKPGHKYSREYAKKELKRIHELFSINSPNAITGLSLREFFEIDEKARIRNDKAVRLIKTKIEGYAYLLNNYNLNNTEN